MAQTHPIDGYDNMQNQEAVNSHTLRENTGDSESYMLRQKHERVQVFPSLGNIDVWRYD